MFVPKDVKIQFLLSDIDQTGDVNTRGISSKLCWGLSST